MKKKPWFLAGILLILTACGAPLASTPAPTPEAIKVFYPPSLQAWADKLAGCADNGPRVGLYIFPTNQLPTNIGPNDVVLQISPISPISGSSYMSQVGEEQIVVIINQANPVSGMPVSELREIYSGQKKSWQENTSQQVQVWVLPDGDPIRSVFDRAVLQAYPVTSEAMLAPDPSAMLEAVAENVGAIGYLPVSFLNSSGPVDPAKVAPIQLDSSLETDLYQPVIAVTLAEPKGQLRSLLVCLESTTP